MGANRSRRRAHTRGYVVNRRVAVIRSITIDDLMVYHGSYLVEVQNASSA